MPETEKVRYLKPGMLAGTAVVALKKEPKIGQFGKMELNFDLDGQNFIFSINPSNPQWQVLIAAFGPVSPKWEGKQIRLFDGKVLKGVNVEPV